MWDSSKFPNENEGLEKTEELVSQSETPFKEIIGRFEEAIRGGDVANVQRELEALSGSAIPRELKCAFANVARRVRSEFWGLRLLRPLVRAEVPPRPAVTDDELCAYAGLLIKVGALSEAQTILESLDESNADVLTFRAQIHTAQWDYAEAARSLKKIIARKDVDDYQKCVASVNLVSAYIFLQKFEEAEELLLQIRRTCLANGWSLLEGNALELAAQVAVIRGQWDEAERLLTKAENKSGAHSHYRLFIEKWRMLAELFQMEAGSSESEKTMTRIEALRRSAVSAGSWETVRDLDYQVARFLKHQNLMLNVYFGTPHVAYKRRIEAIFKRNSWPIPRDYFRKLSSAPTTRVLDLETGHEIGHETGAEFQEPLKPGQMSHRLLNILAMDFYKPIGAGELFSKLYPDEFYNPDSAAERIAQAVKTLRKWFAINAIPLEIAVENTRYSLVATAPYALRIARSSPDPRELLESNYEMQLKMLRFEWPYKSFSAAQAAQHLAVSASNVRAILRKALKEGRAFQSGAGRSTLYRFKK